MKTFDELRISFIQSNLIWENPEANRQVFEKKINQIDSVTDLIILPEMFTTGFSMNASRLAETLGGETVLWMKKLASKKQAAITGSIIISENNHFYNRLIFVHPSGEIQFYDKRHTFTLAKENEVFSAGKSKLIIDYKGWKICTLICYDLRFPVWSRNVENYDLLIYIASWPKTRISAWDTLLKARSIENMCYTIGVNRIGKDANDFEYTGHSIALDCLGNSLSKENNEQDDIVSLTLKKTTLNHYKDKLRFLNDKDGFILK